MAGLPGRLEAHLFPFEMDGDKACFYIRLDLRTNLAH